MDDHDAPARLATPPWWSYPLLALAVALIAWGALSLPPVRDAEHWLADLRLIRLSPPEPRHEEIVVLAISEETLEELPYRSPLDRGFLATVLEGLMDDGARAIGIDLLFDQPTDPDKDRRLVQTLATSPVPVVVAWVDRPREARFMTERQRAFFHRFREASGVQAGLVTLHKDGRGVVRWQNPGLGADDGGAAGFARAVARATGEEFFPGDPTIAYRAPPQDGKAFAEYALRPALAGRFPPAPWVKDRIVLIGAVRPFEDRHLTPWASLHGEGLGAWPGIVIHAHALAQLLDHREAAVPPAWLDGLLILLASLAALGLALTDWRLLNKLVAGILLVSGYWFAMALWYRHGGPLVALLMPSLAFAATLGLIMSLQGQRFRQQQQFLEQAFSCYVAPQVVAELKRDPRRLRLGGEKRDLTLLFTDIAGFTGLSESLAPEQLSQIMNQYLDGMVEILFQHGGTLDKFVGDALVALFGAPGAQHDHPDRAVRCGLAMDRFAEDFRSGQAERGIRLGVTRIGIHSGPAAVGNFGASRQFNYTALGDTVNTAARLEGASKFLGTRILVSADTARRCPGLTFRPAAELVLKGKQTGLLCVEPVPAGAALLDTTVDYREAFDCLADGRISEARQRLEALRVRYPEDLLVAFHLARLDNCHSGIRVVLESK